MQKRLYRSRDNRMLAGVCGGLGDYFGVDPTLVRVGLVVLLFLDGVGLIAYLILALVVPSESGQGRSVEQTLEENVTELAQTAEKLGERVERTFDSRPAERTPSPAPSLAPRTLLGGVLVILGAVLLLRNLNIWWMIPHMWLWPAVFIFCGLVIIVLGQRRRHD